MGETAVPLRTFEQWVDGIFDHAVTRRAWYWAEDADRCVENDEVNVGYLTRLFTQSRHVLSRFDNAQVDQGLTLIASELCSDHAYTITGTGGAAPWPVRRACIRSIFDLYCECFALRCSQGLSPREKVGNPLNHICCMWWDVFPAWPDPNDPKQAEEASEYLGVMERCLTLRHHACLEGALHGLGHWQSIFPKQVESIIERFLRDGDDLPPELVVYARRAKRGGVQ